MIAIDGHLPKTLGISRKELKSAAEYFAMRSSRRVRIPFRDIAVILHGDGDSAAVHAAIMNDPSPTDVITQPYSPMPGEADGIYLNFSDPLPKNYWYKRRLTYRDRLKSYFRVLKPEGTVTFKTDNTDLFNWSVLEIAAADLKILEITRDLHADPEANALNIETEYEAKYSGFGEKIHRCVVRFP